MKKLLILLVFTFTLLLSSCDKKTEYARHELNEAQEKAMFQFACQESLRFLENQNEYTKEDIEELKALLKFAVK